jgi:hypothetical protein
MIEGPSLPRGTETSAALTALGDQALAEALKHTVANGLTLNLSLRNGKKYRVSAPLIIGGQYLQFADAASDKLVRVKFEQVIGFEVLPKSV